MYKLPSFRFFIICLLISAVSGAFLLLESCHQPKAGGMCTYEGLECPTALNQWLTDSMAIAQRDSAYVSLERCMDSVINENAKLKTQLAGCEMQNHSRIPTTFTVTTLDTTQPNWKEYCKYFTPTVVYE